jgi:hypothetical protein
MATLQAQLDETRREAHRLAEQLAGLEAKLDAAVKGQEYALAEDLKAEIDEMRPAWVLAEAQARAMQDVLGQVAWEQAAREAAVIAERHREQARAEYDRAAEAEQEAVAAMHRHLADVEPGLVAVQESIRAALAAQAAATAAKMAAYQAQVALGERGPGARIHGPNDASFRVERSAILRHLVNGTWNQL